MENIVACIKHSGYKSPNGYGKMMYQGKVVYAHRLAYCTVNNVTLESIHGMQIRHTCDNPECVNPEHLLLGTHQDNQDDKVRRGRQVRGEDVHTSVLTVSDVLKIRSMYIPRSRTNGAVALGKLFNVHNTTIDRIVKRKIWKSI